MINIRMTTVTTTTTTTKARATTSSSMTMKTRKKKEEGGGGFVDLGTKINDHNDDDCDYNDRDKSDSEYINENV